jgi:hypothetical protein
VRLVSHPHIPLLDDYEPPLAAQSGIGGEPAVSRGGSLAYGVMVRIIMTTASGFTSLTPPASPN